jgi:predicted Zn-dependent protease
MSIYHSAFAFALTAVFASAFAQDATDGVETQELHAKVVQAVGDYKAGRVDQARQEFQALNRENPNDPEIAKWLGFIDLVQNKGAEAVPLLMLASQKLPNDLEVTNNLGDAYYAAGEYDKALVCYQTVTRSNSTMFIPYYNTGNIYLKRQDYRRAIVERSRCGRSERSRRHL